MPHIEVLNRPVGSLVTADVDQHADGVGELAERAQDGGPHYASAGSTMAAGPLEAIHWAWHRSIAQAAGTSATWRALFVRSLARSSDVFLTRDPKPPAPGSGVCCLGPEMGWAVRNCTLFGMFLL